MRKFSTALSIFSGFLLLLSAGCSLTIPAASDPVNSTLYQLPPQSGGDLLSRHAPIFLVNDIRNDYNRIGTPAARTAGSDDHEIYVDVEQATVYTLTQRFKTDHGEYTNLIYRVHFPETPFPHLTSGKNVGLLVYVTLNDKAQPVLVTTLNTCGCYLAFIPTSNLPENSFPPEWQRNSQNVYGEKLPALIEVREDRPGLLFDLRNATHRVMDIRDLNPADLDGIQTSPYKLKPMSELHRLPTANGETVSFFEEGGPRKGYVKGSGKPLEMLLMSWWAMDLFIGEDKALGPPDETGVVFYTSLKFWARDKSNIWFFPEFLKYWGWNL